MRQKYEKSIYSGIRVGLFININNLLGKIFPENM